MGYHFNKLNWKIIRANNRFNLYTKSQASRAKRSAISKHTAARNRQDIIIRRTWQINYKKDPQKMHRQVMEQLIMQTLWLDLVLRL